MSGFHDLKGKPLYLAITGISNELEAGQLIRLFHDSDPIFSSEAGSMAEGVHVSLHAVETGGLFSASASVRSSGSEIGSGILSFETAKVPSASDTLLQSRKLCAGTALYRALSEAYGVVLPWGSLTGVRPVKLASCALEAGIPAQAVPRILRERTGMQADKAALALSVAIRELPYATPPEHSVSLYVGIPFCSTRCLYCSFTSYPEKRYGHLIPSYLEALAKEIRFTGKWLADTGRTLSSVYVGGGTPTALPGERLQSLLSLMDTELPMKTCLEYTVEAGRPDTLDREKLDMIKAAGATRISINPQTMRAETLAAIGRDHTPEQVEEAFALARKAGFVNINADLIAGLPGEVPGHFRATLDRMSPLRPDSLTVHTMAVKRASRLHEAICAGTAGPAAPDAAVTEMIADAAAYASSHGLFPYYLYRQKNILANLENVGYARTGCECRYNVETMSERQTIVAVGSGGITKVSHEGKQLERVFNVRELGHYIGRIDEMISRKRELLTRHM
jgi:coproporphyrinogen dehydrogenase HemZ